eukprot:2910640-Prymnesium_polylepis.1
MQTLPAITRPPHDPPPHPPQTLTPLRRTTDDRDVLFHRWSPPACTPRFSPTTSSSSGTPATRACSANSLRRRRHRTKPSSRRTPRAHALDTHPE